MSADLLIRRAVPADAEQLAALYAQPSLVWGTLQQPYANVELWRTRLQPNDEHILLVACVGDAVVGAIGLHLHPLRSRRKHAAALGMGVREDWQGKGVGTALMQAVIDLADRWLNVTRLELEVFVDNAPAIRLYQKFGFEIEGTARQFAFRDGMYADVYYMARLRPTL